MWVAGTYILVSACIRRPQVYVGTSHLTSETVIHWTWSSMTRQNNWLAGSRVLFSLAPSTEKKICAAALSSLGSGDLGLDPHPCVPCALPSEPSPNFLSSTAYKEALVQYGLRFVFPTWSLPRCRSDFHYLFLLNPPKIKLEKCDLLCSLIEDRVGKYL